MQLLRLTIPCLALVLWLPGAFAQQGDAQITMLTGKATALSPDGVLRDLAKGGAVHEGEMLATGPNSYMNLKFSDRGLMLLRPVTRFRIEDFRYAAAVPAPPPAKPAKPAKRAKRAKQRDVVPAAPAAPPPARALFRLLKGGFRTITGLIGKGNSGEYLVNTPTATIGIRGTDYIAVLCDAACALDPVIRAALPQGARSDGALITGVTDGRITVTSTPPDCPDKKPDQPCPAVTMEVSSGQYLITTADGKQHLLAGEPLFMRSDPMPSPAECL